MRKAAIVLVSSCLVLTSCGAVRDSRFNPINWFGRSKSQPVAEGVEVNPLIPRRNAFAAAPKTEPGILIPEVTDLTIERRPGGAVILARGMADKIGISKARLKLVKEESTGDTLVYQFLYVPFPTGIDGGNAEARSVSVAADVTERELSRTKRIVVRGARNERTTRR